MSAPAFRASDRPAQCDWNLGRRVLRAKGVQIDTIAKVGLVDKFQEDVREGRYESSTAGPFLSRAISMATVVNELAPPFDALGKTLVCDMGEAGIHLKPRENFVSMPPHAVASPHFRPEGHRTNTDASTKAEYLALWLELQKHRWTEGRFFFTTEEDRLGIGPADTMEDDIVCVLHGASVPYILRPALRFVPQLPPTRRMTDPHLSPSPWFEHPSNGVPRHVDAALASSSGSPRFDPTIPPRLHTGAGAGPGTVSQSRWFGLDDQKCTVVGER